jgi:CubicO group peptidase (beta-lactamase class C family)
VPELAVVDSLTTDFMERWEIPGGSAALVKNGRLVYARGFGLADSTLDMPAQPFTRFRIASISKPITALTIMKLIESGLLGIDDLVFGTEGLLNDPLYSPIQDNRVFDITVRHLLQHTSGWDHANANDPIFYPVDVAIAMGEEPPASAVTTIRYVLGQELDSDPGTQFSYSNVGYIVLGRIIETVTGLGYEEAVRTYLLQPLGLNAVRLGRNFYEERGLSEAAYSDYPGAPLQPSFYGDGTFVPAPYGYFNLLALDSTAGWIASASDLLCLLSAVDGDPYRPDILDPATLELMLTPCPVHPSYGMGWSLDANGEYWGHSGSIPGTSTIFYRLSDGVCMAFLFNSLPADRVAHWNDFGYLITQILQSVEVWPNIDFWDPLSDVTAEEVPASVVLMPNYPNPFNPSTVIRFQVPAPSHVVLRIHDVRGRHIITLLDETLPGGPQAVIWEGVDRFGAEVGAGVYLYSLQAYGQMATRAMVLVK